MIEIQRLQKLIRQFHDMAVLVIGDVILDEYIWGTVTRISPEAPVPVIDVTSESLRLGGATNVGHNLQTLGGKSYICGVIGEDAAGKKLQHALQTSGVDPGKLITVPGRATTLKTRIIAHHQQIARLDREDRSDLTDEQTAQLLANARELLPVIDAIIIEDYGKGVVTGDLVKQIVALARQAGTIVAVDPKTSHFTRYRGVSVITPNHHEAGASLHLSIDTHRQLLRAGRQLLEKLSCEYVLITRGEEGMSLFEQQSRMVTHVPTMTQEVFDVTGAGDTVIATLTLGLASGAAPIDAVLLSNAAAGVVVGKVGTATINQGELQNALTKMEQLDIKRESFA